MDPVEVPVPATNHGQRPQFDPAILAAAEAAIDQLRRDADQSNGLPDARKVHI